MIGLDSGLSTIDEIIKYSAGMQMKAVPSQFTCIEFRLPLELVHIGHREPSCRHAAPRPIFEASTNSVTNFEGSKYLRNEVQRCLPAELRVFVGTVAPNSSLRNSAATRLVAKSSR